MSDKLDDLKVQREKLETALSQIRREIRHLEELEFVEQVETLRIDAKVARVVWEDSHRPNQYGEPKSINDAILSARGWLEAARFHYNMKVQFDNKKAVAEDATYRTVVYLEAIS